MIETLSVVIPSITYALYVPGSPSDLNTGNGTEGTMVCTSLGSLFPVFKSEGEPGTYIKNSIESHPSRERAHGRGDAQLRFELFAQ